MYKKLFFLFFLIFIHTTHASEHALTSNKKDNPQQQFSIKKYSKIMQSIIIHGSQSPKEAGELMRLFIPVNQEIHLFFDDMKKCSSLVKKISTQFCCSNEAAAIALNTKTAKQLLGEQKTFLDECLKQNSRNELDKHKKNNINLDFTYEPNCHTALTKCCAEQPSKDHNIRWLLENGANIYHTTASGCSTITYFFDVPSIIPTLLERSDFNVNFRYNNGNTLLMGLILYTKYHGDLCYGFTKYEAIALLLKKNADPQLSNNRGETPITAANEIFDLRFRQPIQDAIDGKFTPKQES